MMSTASSPSLLSNYPLIPLLTTTTPAKSHFPTRRKPFPSSSSSNSRISCSQNPSPQQQQQLNLSVLRFTLGIPGLDESYLPRYIGYAFGTLLLLNHFVGSDASSSITPAQLRTEALGVALTGYSIAVPYLGRFLKGATPTDQKSIPEGAEQIFFMSTNIADTLKEDLAWGTYVLLRNTNSVSVLISFQDAFCVRGYWKTPKDVPKGDALKWFEEQIQRTGFSDLKDAIYFQQATDSDLSEMVPLGIRSLLVQPIFEAPKVGSNQTQKKSKGFVLVASSIDYAYNEKDKAWIAAIANKFGG